MASVQSVQTIIEADSAAVWRWLTVPELMNRWMHSISDMRTDDGASLHPGSRLLFIARGQERSTTVVELVPRRMLTLRSTQGSFTADYRYRLIDGVDHCAVALDVRCEATGPARILAPLIRMLMWRNDKGQLVQLVAAMQASGDTSG